MAIADIGAHTTSVIVVQNGRVIYTREQNIGGARLTEDIQHRYQYEPEQAEAAKLEGNLPENYEAQVQAPFLDAVAQEIRGALQFYRAAGSGEDVGAVWLVGGCASAPDLARVVSQYAGVPARVFNPFANLRMAPQVEASRLKEAAPSLAVACGLALRRFDA